VYEVGLENPNSPVANMPGSQNQFVLISARKSRGADYWDKVTTMCEIATAK